MKTHKDLNVWKEGIVLTAAVYRVTRSFPKEEVYALSQQLRRAAVSVPSNISEGAARNKTNDFIRFLRIALGSLAEVETQIIIAEELNYLNQGEYYDFLAKIKMIRIQLHGLIKSIENRELNGK
jgi:four helix bundle protein